jgi:hypothetical protein
VDHRIIEELEIYQVDFLILPIEEQLDLIDCLLKENHTAKDLNKVQKLGQDHQNRYSIEGRLL